MKIFDSHSDTMADIMAKRHAGETDIIKKYHMPDYKRRSRRHHVRSLD